MKLPEPIDTCKYKSKSNQYMCSLFDMSCAMFHTRIASHPIKICVYKQEKENYQWKPKE